MKGYGFADIDDDDTMTRPCPRWKKSKTLLTNPSHSRTMKIIFAGQSTN
jgi:hypothetical protein